MKKLLIAAMSVAVLMFSLAACTAAAVTGPDLTQGGTVRLSEETQLNIVLDEKGNVETVIACHDERNAVLAEYPDFKGKDCRTVTAELTEAINAAGFYVEDVEQEQFGLSLELERGIGFPAGKILDNAAEKAQERMSGNNQTVPVATEGTQQSRICTNPHCDDWDCDDLYCDDGICTNPHCNERDCDDPYCDDGVCTNLRCNDWDCDDRYCDD